MIKVRALLPRSDERMLIMGASGSGKTTLAKALLAAARGPILAIDPKGTLGGRGGLEGYTIIRDPRQLGRLRKCHTHVQYRPAGEFVHAKHYDAVYRWAYERGNILVYTDEVFATMRGTQAPDWQRACVTAGRELGVGMISCTQRPRGIDQRLLSESEVLACFRLRNPDDMKYVAAYMGPEALRVPPRYAFHFWREGDEEISLKRIAMGGDNQ